jgi:hypothetical protein
VEQGIVAALADIRDLDAVLAEPAIHSAIDLSQPACVILTAVAQFLPPEQVAEITAGYMRAMAPGSWLVFSTEHILGKAPRDRLTRMYDEDRFYNHCPEGIAAFLNDLELLDPGIAEARRWLGGLDGVPDEPGQLGYMLCAVGTKSWPVAADGG